VGGREAQLGGHDSCWYVGLVLASFVMYYLPVCGWLWQEKV